MNVQQDRTNLEMKKLLDIYIVLCARYALVIIYFL